MTLFQVEVVNVVMYFRNLMIPVMQKMQFTNFTAVNSWVRGKVIVVLKYAVSDPCNRVIVEHARGNNRDRDGGGGGGRDYRGGDRGSGGRDYRGHSDRGRNNK